MTPSCTALLCSTRFDCEVNCLSHRPQENLTPSRTQLLCRARLPIEDAWLSQISQQYFPSLLWKVLLFIFIILLDTLCWCILVTVWYIMVNIVISIFLAHWAYTERTLHFFQQTSILGNSFDDHYSINKIVSEMKINIESTVLSHSYWHERRRFRRHSSGGRLARTFVDRYFHHFFFHFQCFQFFSPSQPFLK